MKYYKIAYIAFISILMIFFYNFGMEIAPELQYADIKNIKEKLSLLIIIENQQTILNEQIEPPICSAMYFNFLMAQQQEQDPKEEKGKILHQRYEQRIETEAMACINYLAADKTLSSEEKLKRIEVSFSDKSMFFLRKTYKANKESLRAKHLLDAYKHQYAEKRIKIKKPITPIWLQTPVKPSKPSTPRARQELSKKELVDDTNKIIFTKLTYEKLMYDYQAYTDCRKRGIDCNVGDPFIRVEVIKTSSAGVIMSLPLPIFINDEGNVKQEIFLPFSEKPFIIEAVEAELLRRELPRIAIKFYNNLEPDYNKMWRNYLVTRGVLQNQDGKYIHGPNGCKQLLERYFELWGISEQNYKQQPISIQPQQKKVSDEEPQPQPTIVIRFFTAVGQGIVNAFKWLFSWFQ